MQKALVVLLFLIFAAGANSADAQHKRRKKERRHAHRVTAAPVRAGSATYKQEADDAPEKAQRKKDRAERRRQKYERRHRRSGRAGELPVVKKNIPEVKKKQTITFPTTAMKQAYRIDVLVPVYLDELVQAGGITFSGKMPDKAGPGLAFYQGVKIAADSLKRAGFNIELYVHDIASYSEMPANLITRGMLDSADLLLGAVPSKDIPILAAFAKKKHINFVSALTADDAGVKNNEYFTLLQPSVRTHCEWLSSHAMKDNGGKRISVLYQLNTPLEDSAFKYLTASIQGKTDMVTLYCRPFPGRDTLQRMVDPKGRNVIIMPILDAGYADSVLSRISASFPAAYFDVYGMPTWGSLPSLRRAGVYKNITVHITDAFNIDVSTAAAKYVVSSFRKLYGGRPAEYVYRGYEALSWYAHLLRQQGTIFNEKYSDITGAPFTRFDVQPQWNSDLDFMFYENKHIVTLTFHDGEVKVAE